MSGVLIWIDHFRGTALPISWEALAAAHKAADAHHIPVTALVFGQNIEQVVQQAFAYGAERVVRCDDETLADFRLEPYAALLDKIVQDEQPLAVFGPASLRGRELLAAAAADANAGLLSDITALEVVGDGLQAIRPVYDAKVNSTATINGGTIQIVTRRRPRCRAIDAHAHKPGGGSRGAPSLAPTHTVTKKTSLPGN